MLDLKKMLYHNVKVTPYRFGRKITLYDTDKKRGISMERIINDQTANPGPIGLTGFALATILTSITATAGIASSAMALAMAAFCGGMAQIFAGWMAWKKGDTFNGCVFVTYGTFWWTNAFMTIASYSGFMPVDHLTWGWYFIVWAILTSLLFIGTLNGPIPIRILFFTLAALYYVLAYMNFNQIPGDSSIGVISGIIGLICGISAMYAAVADALHAKLDRRILP